MISLDVKSAELFRAISSGCGRNPAIITWGSGADVEVPAVVGGVFRVVTGCVGVVGGCVTVVNAWQNKSQTELEMIRNEQLADALPSSADVWLWWADTSLVAEAW